MTPVVRYPLRDLALLLALGLVVRSIAAVLVPSPPYTEPAYYSLVAERLVDGFGFTVPVLYSFLEVGGQLPVNPGLPVDSNGHWMPLTSVVAAGAMSIFGAGWRAGEAAMVVLSLGLIGLTHLLAWELWSGRRAALIAGLLAVFAGPFLVLYPLVENFAVFGVTGALALYAAMRAASGKSRRPVAWIIASGALVGLATLARIDGLLLLVAPALAAWLLRSRLGRGRTRWIGIGVGAACACLLVLLPWAVRNQVVYGAVLPTVGGHTLWITSYNEQFSVGSEISLSTYLASGPLEIVGAKLGSAIELLGRTISISGGIFVVFAVGGAWMQRRRPEVTVFLTYWLLMFLVMAVVFTLHAPKGAFMHSAPAWLPAFYALAAGAVAPVSSALGTGWRFLQRERTHRFIGTVGVAGAVILSVAASGVLVLQWRDAADRLRPAADYLRETAGRDDVLMYADAPRLHLLTGNPVVAAPFDPYDVIEDVVRAYDVKWLVVTLEAGQARDPLGLWEGSSAVDARGAHPAFIAGDPVLEAPGVRVFEVSTSP